MMGWSDPKMSPLTIWLSSEYDSWPADPVKHTFSGGFCTAKRGRGGGGEQGCPRIMRVRLMQTRRVVPNEQNPPWPAETAQAAS